MSSEETINNASVVQILAGELAEFGVSIGLIQQGNEQLGSHFAVPCFPLAKELQKSPQAIAENIAQKLESPIVQKAEAVAGYLNVWLKQEALNILIVESLEPGTQLKGQKILCEFSDPNPFKVLHAGHFYTSVVGDTIARLFESAGAEVVRLNFGGDVGRHVAITMWAVMRAVDGDPDKLLEIPEAEQSQWLSQRYVEGTAAFNEDEAIKQEITDLNQAIYLIHSAGDTDSDLAKIYWTCRQWSYDYFDDFYKSIGVKFDKYYPESSTAPLGLETVQAQLANGVYQESDGAVIFKGEDYDLHTRVFINKNGLPTYEAKDVGLAFAKENDYQPDRSIIITGNDITEYMRVVLKSMEQFAPEIVAKTTHITHGIVKLQGSVKMSSRLGNFFAAADVLQAAEEAALIEHPDTPRASILAAIKYSFLKQGIGGDIIFDPKESVNLRGNSGPYLQYAYARAFSILAKAEADHDAQLPDLEANEQILLSKIAAYGWAKQQATDQLAPQKLCTYLYELTQAFNSFYESNRIIDDERQQVRLQLLEKYTNVLKQGLNILGIEALQKM